MIGQSSLQVPHFVSFCEKVHLHVLRHYFRLNFAKVIIKNETQIQFTKINTILMIRCDIMGNFV